MALTSTLLQLRTAVRERGGYRRSTSLTDPILNEFVNYGIVEVHDLLAKHNPDFLTKQTVPDLVTVANVPTVALPSDFYKLRRVDLIRSGDPSRLRSFEIDDETMLAEDSLWGFGTFYRYMLQAAFLRLVPTPTVVDTIRLWYIPHATRLSLDTDVYDGIGGADDLVIEHALVRAAERDRRPAQDHQVAVQRLEKRLMFAVEARDQSEPDYLPDLGRWSLL